MNCMESRANVVDALTMVNEKGDKMREGRISTWKLLNNDKTELTAGRGLTRKNHENSENGGK